MAKMELSKAGYRKNDQRLQRLILVHTNGEKTVKIAKQIAKNLSEIGIKVSLKEVPYEKDGLWEDTLAKGKYHMFLMGFKSNSGTQEILSDNKMATDLLKPLFTSNGEANFFYINDKFLDSKLSEKNPSLSEKELKELNLYLQANPITVNLFYIKKILL